jgi:RibD C-terminal domain
VATVGVLERGHRSKNRQNQATARTRFARLDLLQTLLEHDLVDAFWLMIYPITLGSGKRLFAAGTIPAAFKVTESHVTPNGVIVVNYERAGAVASVE